MENNRHCIMSVVSSDWYQHVIPLFVRCVRSWGEGVDTMIYVRGETDDMTNKCMDIMEKSGVCKIGVTDHQRRLDPDNYGTGISSTNAARFLHCDKELLKYEYVLITDIDLMLFQNPFLWHIALMATFGDVFAGHHGPYHKPRRPEVCPSWEGSFERVAGGFFCVTPEWYARTEKQREYQASDLADGRLGWWRESDEVVLARIIKGSSLKMPVSKYFPPELRGVHLGDFKESMRHRWTNMAKMNDKLTADNCRAFVDMEKDPNWQKILDILREDAILKQILDNVRTHINERGIA